MKIKTLCILLVLQSGFYLSNFAQKEAFTKELNLENILHYSVDTINKKHLFYTIKKVNENTVNVINYKYDVDFENQEKTIETLSFTEAKNKYKWWNFDKESKVEDSFSRFWGGKSIGYKTVTQKQKYNWEEFEYDITESVNEKEGYPFSEKKNRQYLRYYYDQYSKSKDCWYSILQKSIYLDLVKINRDLTFSVRPLNTDLAFPVENKIIFNNKKSEHYIICDRNKANIPKKASVLNTKGCFLVLFDSDLKPLKELNLNIIDEEHTNISMRLNDNHIYVYAKDAILIYDLDLNLKDKIEKQYSYYTQFVKKISENSRVEVNTTYLKQYICLYDNNNNLIKHLKITEKFSFVEEFNINGTTYLLLATYNSRKTGANEVQYHIIECTSNNLKIVKTINNEAIKIPNKDLANNVMFKSNKFGISNHVISNKQITESGGLIFNSYLKTGYHYFSRTLLLDKYFNLSLYEIYGCTSSKNSLSQSIVTSKNNIYWITTANKNPTGKGKNLFPKIVHIDAVSKEIKGKLFLDDFKSHSGFPILKSFDNNSVIVLSDDFKVKKIVF